MQTRRLAIGCDFTYVAAISTPVIFQVQPAEAPRISLEGGQWALNGLTAIRGYTDLYGNPCLRACFGRAVEQPPEPGAAVPRRRGLGALFGAQIPPGWQPGAGDQRPRPQRT